MSCHSSWVVMAVCHQDDASLLLLWLQCPASCAVCVSWVPPSHCWLSVFVLTLIYACIPDISVVCQYAHFNFIVLALMGYSYLYVLLVKAIVFSHLCLALGGASLCTPLEACYSLATIARRLPSAFILVYLVIHPYAVPCLY